MCIAKQRDLSKKERGNWGSSGAHQFAGNLQSFAFEAPVL